MSSSSSAHEPLHEPPNPDRAWQVLSLVNEWLRHAEAKLGVLLAAAGVVGGLLFNLVEGRENTEWWFDSAAVVCAAAAAIAGLFAAIGLLPRLKVPHRNAAIPNPLFFRDIAVERRSDYREELVSLTTDPEAFVARVAEQVWSNSRVATDKFSWASKSTVALAVSLAALVVLAAGVAVQSQR